MNRKGDKALIVGLDIGTSKVVALYNQARAMFTPGGADVRALRLDPRGSWSLVLSNGTDVIIGSSEARLRLARFARLMPQLLSQKQLPLVRADLRYTNGFALSWPSPAARTVAPQSQGTT
jgi:cell division protein FtsQ